MINQDMSEVVLVKGWKKGASWSFPRGKINKDELDLDCAIREVYEETGFDIKEARLVGNEEGMKYIDVTMREQHMRLYVFRGVPTDTYFEPRTRKEISAIQWYKLSELPTLKKKKQQQEGRGEDLATNANRFYMVAPFLNPLNKWIAQQKRLDKIVNQGHPNATSKEVQTTPFSVNDGTFANSANEHVAGDDMGTLLANLRGSQQSASTSDLPEVARPFDAAQDATAQLRNLLHVNPAASTNVTQSSTKTSGVPGQAVTNGKDSNALLALLRGKGATRDQIPERPLEQAIERPAEPSPQIRNHHHVPSQHIPNLPSSPSFPYPVIHDQQPEYDSQTFIHSSKPPFHTTDQPFQSQHHNQLNITHTIPAQQYHQLSYLIDSKPSLATRAHLKRQVPAPYQRTGDPIFSQRSQYPTNLPPSIPPASKLPPPKLTTHSSALLDLFRIDRPTQISPDNQPSQPLTAHRSVVSNVGGPRDHSEVSPLTEQSNERDLHVKMDLTREDEERNSKLAAWGDFQATSERQNAEERHRNAETNAERLAEEARTGIRHNLQLPTMSETWRQVKVDDDANQRRVISVRKPPGVSQQSSETQRQDSQVPTSNLDELTQEFTLAETGHPTNPLHQSQQDIQPRAKPGPSQKLQSVPPVEPKETLRRNPDHKSALLDLFRSPSSSTAHPSKSTASLEPPGPPVELSALSSPGHSRETSQAERFAPRYQSQSVRVDSDGIQERPKDNLKTRKSPMSATVSGPLNVPNFDVITQKPKELNAPVENSGSGQVQEGQPLTILSRPISTQSTSQAGQRTASASVRRATVVPAAAMTYEDFRKNVSTTPVQFQPQILRRPTETSSLSQAPTFPLRVQPSRPLGEPTPFDRHASRSQGHKEGLLSLFGKSAPLVPANNSSSATPISPVSEKLVSQPGKSTFVSPLTSRSRMGSLASPSQEETIKSGGAQSPRLPGDKKFLLDYLEGVAKERR